MIWLINHLLELHGGVCICGKPADFSGIMLGLSITPAVLPVVANSSDHNQMTFFEFSLSPLTTPLTPNEVWDFHRYRISRLSCNTLKPISIKLISLGSNSGCEIVRYSTPLLGKPTQRSISPKGRQMLLIQFEDNKGLKIIAVLDFCRCLNLFQCLFKELLAMSKDVVISQEFQGWQ